MRNLLRNLLRHLLRNLLRHLLRNLLLDLFTDDTLTTDHRYKESELAIECSVWQFAIEALQSQPTTNTHLINILYL